MKLPIAFPGQNTPKSPQLVLAADIGATKTHLALFQVREDQAKLIREAKYPSKEYDSFSDLLAIFKWNDPMPEVLSIAFAGPILDGRAQATNLDWYIDLDELCKQLDFDNIFLINDLQAHAYGLATLKEKDYQTIHIGNPLLKGNAAIIAPGSGLGEAGLFWDGQHLHPFATEGGHADFGPQDIIDDHLLRSLRKQYGHVSWERLVSGMGILNIYEFLRTQEGSPPPEWFVEKSKTIDEAGAVSHGARKGDPLCKKAMNLFFKYLAIESANLAVKFQATGGIFIGGGIVPKNLDLLNVSDFIEHFYDKGRFRAMLKEVPIYILLNQKTALLGAAYYGAHAKKGNHISNKEAIRL